jgi:hypothetical protein
LTVENPKLAVADPKLSEAIEPIQKVKPFSFLILKRRGVIHADAGARPRHAGVGGGVGNSVPKRTKEDSIKTTAPNKAVEQ